MYDILSNVAVSKKTVLLRCDLNLPIKNGQVSDNTRLIKSLDTINYLIESQSKIIICTHLGRPKIQDASNSTKIIADLLQKYVPVKVHFVEELSRSAIENKIKQIEYGEIMFLENIRFLPEETTNDTQLGLMLSEYANIYVNDAFACSHRSHASIESVTHFIKSCAGFNFDFEYKKISEYINNPIKPLTSIVGGGKISTKLDLINNLVKISDFLFLSGGILNTYLLNQGFNIGRSIYEPESQDTIQNIINNADKYQCKIILPEKVVCISAKNKVIHRNLSEIKSTDTILDVEINKLTDVLENSKMCIWNGPLGMYEDERFSKGSIDLAFKISSLTKHGKINSLAGGGDVIACINKAGVFKDFSFISTAGGAFLEMISGYKLPGVSALERNLLQDQDIIKK